MCTIVSDTTGIVARVNPFRYRGYYYDVEIGLYYLQSRYYNPVVGRFVNGDDTRFICYVFNTTHNAYSFAKNDPITDGEYLGYISLSAIAMIICALVGGIAKLESACALINQSWFKKKHSVSAGLLVCLVAFIYGGVDGLTKYKKITGKWQIACGVIGAVVAVAEYVAVSGRNKKKYSPNSLLWVAVKGFANTIDIPKTGIVRDLVERILTNIGQKSLLWVLNYM